MCGSDKFELVPYAPGTERPEYILKNGKAFNIYGAKIYIEEMQVKYDRLMVLLSERDELVDDVYDYGKSNPASAPQCVTDLVEKMDQLPD